MQGHHFMIIGSKLRNDKWLYVGDFRQCECQRRDYKDTVSKHSSNPLKKNDRKHFVTVNYFRNVEFSLL